MTAIGSARRRHLGIKRHIVMMRVADTDPLHRCEIEIPALDVAVESRPLVVANVDFDSDPAQHRLYHFSHPRPFRRGFIDETEIAHSVSADWVAGFVEQMTRAIRINRIARDITVVCPVFWTE